MRNLWIILAVAAPLAAQQGFDFKSLDKLGAQAKETTNVTLEGPTLQLAANFLGADGDSDAASLKEMVSKLKGVYVRAWEFDKDGMYSMADVEPFRAYIRAGQWTRVVEVKQEKEISEVYLKAGAAQQFGGVAVIDAEPRELTIVYIEGNISIADVGKLSGTLDIPDLDVLKRGSGAKPGGNAKKEE